MKRRSSSILFIVYLSTTYLLGQVELRINNACNYTTGQKDTLINIFEASKEAESIVNTIVSKIGLVPNFTLKGANVSNALATTQGKQRYILYSTTFLVNFEKEAKTKWAVYSVLAHEIAHHYNNDDLDETDNNVRKQFELKADLFAGSILRKLGATLEQAQAGINTFSLESESITHPKKNARLEAVASGWASGGTGGTETEPISKIDNLVSIEKGAFSMGLDNGFSTQKPARQVQIKGFYISPYEVTFEEYDDYCQTRNLASNLRPSDNGFGRGKHPVINVSWLDAVNYCNWLSEKNKLTPVYVFKNGTAERVPNANGYRLPTEAEWEYAATFDKQNPNLRFSGSDNSSDVAVTAENAKNHTDNVGSKKTNALGLYDLSGNVWEWVEDCWIKNYQAAPQDGSARLSGNCKERVLRGGSYALTNSLATTRSRYKKRIDERLKDVGFRVCRSN